jgi:hypothetical protein
MLTVTYAECHIKAPYAECRYAEFANGNIALGLLCLNNTDNNKKLVTCGPFNK